MNKGKTIFAQIMSIFNEYEFKKCVNRFKGDRHTIKFNCRDQFTVMSCARFTDMADLRDIETTLNLCGDLYRSCIKAMPKSTLAKANDTKRYGLVPSLHSIPNSIGQALFQRADIRELYNQQTVPTVVPEADPVKQLTLLWYNYSGQQ